MRRSITFTNLYREFQPTSKNIHRYISRGSATDSVNVPVTQRPFQCTHTYLNHNYSLLNISLFGSYCQTQSFSWYCHTSHCSDLLSITKATTHFSTLRQTSLSSSDRVRWLSTNSTSVSPPPTPSTQSECLPKVEADLQNEIQIPEPPTNCCMSGCANCVWITYAQELAQLYKDSGKAAERVMNAIDDPSLKVFLNLELKNKLNSDSED